MKPDLYDISWKVDEPTYRQDEALSYSTLARYEREGFNRLDHLFDRLETPSLTFGSAVDALITGSQEEFDNNFMVADFPSISDSLQTIAKRLFSMFSGEHRTIDTIDDNVIADIGESCDFYANPKYRNYRIKLIKEGCQEYYSMMYAAQGKTILNTETKKQVDDTVRALRESTATRRYFAPDSPFDDDIRHYYQLKFKGSFNNVFYRCMADLIIVDHRNKEIHPVDLKTSSHAEWDFAKSFIQWNYHIQARLYWRIIRQNLNKHPEFKEYTLKNYKFIVVNRDTLTPLVWEFEDSQKKGTLLYGSDLHIKLRDPFTIGEELNSYLINRPRVPAGIDTEGVNKLKDKLLCL